MIGEIDLLNTSIVILLHSCISSPKNSVAKSGYALLLACVVCVSSKVILICWFKINRSFLKLVKKQFHVLLIPCLLFLHGLTWCFAI